MKMPQPPTELIQQWLSRPWVNYTLAGLWLAAAIVTPEKFSSLGCALSAGILAASGLYIALIQRMGRANDDMRDMMHRMADAIAFRDAAMHALMNSKIREVTVGLGTEQDDGKPITKH